MWVRSSENDTLELAVYVRHGPPIHPGTEAHQLRAVYFERCEAVVLKGIKGEGGGRASDMRVYVLCGEEHR